MGQTKINYKQGLTYFRHYSLRFPNWYTEEGIMQYKSMLVQKYGASSVNTYMIPVKRFFKYMFEQGYFPKNPASEIRNLKTDSKRGSFTVNEIQLLLQTIKNINRPTWLRDYVLTRLIAKTG